MAASIEYETTEVIICGCGPTGAMLSVLLSQLGVNNICLDREADIVTDPRGIALDEDGIRALQACGILDKVYSEIGRCMEIFNFVGGVHSNLYTKPFAKMDYGTSEGGTGHVGFICHKQPTLEKHLRRRIAEEKCSDLRTSCTLTAIEEDDEWVYATYQESTGIEHRIKSRFLIGADGKTGFTRKQYLEPRGILMEQISEIGSYAETWVAMNLRFTLPTPKSHPEFPLWQQGYTSEQVYDLFVPRNFRFLCNPERPAVCGRFGQPEDRLWRFEYVVSEGEDGTEMAATHNVKKIVYPYLQHPGSWYSLSEDVAYPEDCIEILRSRPFFFSARSCNEWAKGRVLLCGDSAHVFPPYGGQGIASGFRDVLGLAWRLKVACQDKPSSYESLFRAWYVERKQQLEHSLAATVENGRYVTERNPLRIFLRDWQLWLIQLIPSWKRWLEKGARREGMCRYKGQSGLHFLSERGGGVLCPQLYCRSLNDSGFDIVFLDDIVHARGKHGLLQLLVCIESGAEIPKVCQQLESLEVEKLSQGLVKQSEATILVENERARPIGTAQPTLPLNDCAVLRIAETDEFAASPLCKDRPEPQYYDPHLISKVFPSKKYILIRPDRFTFAACATEDELRKALELIDPILSGKR